VSKLEKLLMTVVTIFLEKYENVLAVPFKGLVLILKRRLLICENRYVEVKSYTSQF